MKEKFLDFPNHSFYEYEGNIYEYYKDNEYFLKTTGWNSGEDRRIDKSKINIKKLVYIKPEKAKLMINEHWNSVTRTWVHNNVKYSNEGELPKDFYKIPNHTFTYTSKFNTDYTYTESYKLVWHQGHLFWCNTSCYWPRIMLFKFDDIDKLDNTVFVKWTNIKNCKPVINEYGEYI